MADSQLHRRICASYVCKRRYKEKVTKMYETELFLTEKSTN